VAGQELNCNPTEACDGGECGGDMIGAERTTTLGRGMVVVKGGGNVIGGDLGGSDAQGAARSRVQRRQQRAPFVELC
jgi:hypothetical protein